MPWWNAVPGILNGKDANDEDMSLKFALNLSCSSPLGSKLTIMWPITFRLNCSISNPNYYMSGEDSPLGAEIPEKKISHFSISHLETEENK